jgi:hypothetical protein
MVQRIVPSSVSVRSPLNDSTVSTVYKAVSRPLNKPSGCVTVPPGLQTQSHARFGDSAVNVQQRIVLQLTGPAGQ